MEQFIVLIKSNPIYMGIAVVIALVILFGFVKKMFKMVLVLAAVIVIYIGYMMVTGKEISVDSLQAELQKATGKITEKVGEATENAVNETVKKVLDKK
ncbi:MAG: hypothetical protein HQ509_07535 [Candidatus Marinimicrobia bacterium]|nr:hypothetical protein [Candidatus Neomarinimicrobiota bacterium]